MLMLATFNANVTAAAVNQWVQIDIRWAMEACIDSYLYRLPPVQTADFSAFNLGARQCPTAATSASLPGASSLLSTALPIYSCVASYIIPYRLTQTTAKPESPIY